MIHELVEKFEKTPKASKKIFIFLCAAAVILILGVSVVVANTVAVMYAAAAPIDAMLASVLVSGITALAGIALNQQQKVDTATRVAALEAAAVRPPENAAGDP